MITYFILFILASTGLFANDFRDGKIQFSVQVNQRTVYYDHAFVSVLPRSVVDLQFDPGDDINIGVDGNHFALEDGRFLWQADNTSSHDVLNIQHLQSGQILQLHVFTLEPASDVDRYGYLNDYRIGTYPTPYKSLPAYKKPSGFITVTESMLDIQVSPHFKLGQFICKQESDYPKYLLLNPLLLDKLELFLAKINESGYPAQSLHVMSGYRTPYYNKLIGNVKNSRHVYGVAADVFLDVAPQDNYMDDLNQDGKNNIDDVNIMYQIANKIAKETKRDKLVGGIGVYKKNSVRGPFIHLDVRGTRARW